MECKMEPLLGMRIGGGGTTDGMVRGGKLVLLVYLPSNIERTPILGLGRGYCRRLSGKLNRA